MDWNEIDSRLEGIGKDRRWLSEQTSYTYDTVRNTLAPNATKRSDRMLAILSRAIEDEEARQRGAERTPGVFDIFLDEESLDRADRASRVVHAPSLAAFCRDVIDEAATRILEEEATGVPTPGPNPTLYHGRPDPVELKVADETTDPAADDAAGKSIHPLPGAADARGGESSPRGNGAGAA